MPLPRTVAAFVLATLLLASSGVPAQSTDGVAEPDSDRRYALPFERNAQFTAREALYAIAEAYPQQIDRVAYRDGDWAARVSGEWFFFAEGRLLPETERRRVDEFDPYPFYRYDRELSDPPRYSEEQEEAIVRRVSELDGNPIRRHPGLLNAIWRVDDRGSAWDRQKTTYFLGIQTLVHREILEDLAAVEERILTLAESDREIRAFIGGLASAYGYTYRQVDGTDSLSYHAYGVAIDLIPRDYKRWQMYWRWAREAGIAWYRVSNEERFLIPEPVVAAFEAHGFVWGGKWLFYDTIHFEYRPEILLLNGFEVDLR